jgi:hydrogenase nickel incorporation protein HypB
MCGTCGCDSPGGTVIDLEERLLARNDHLASHVREWLAGIDVRAYNLMSSPGSGKTTLLERTVRELGLPCSVIEGDQETTFDADRIRASGVRAVQVNTGAGCHLDAVMVRRALSELDPAAGSVVFIENVGNLVCPGSFDLGEDVRIVLTSTTEGEDKPLKYPTIFNTADIAVITKIDLSEAAEFDLAAARSNIQNVRPGMKIFEISAKKDQGIDEITAFLEKQKSDVVPVS